MDSERVCPECGHDFEKHGQSNCVKCDCKRSQAEVNLLIARDEWRHNYDVANNMLKSALEKRAEAAECFATAMQELCDISNLIQDFTVLSDGETLLSGIKRIGAERNEARNIARRMYRERNEIYRDLCAAENEIKRLRIAVMELWKIETGRDICYPSIDDGYGNSILAWCPQCGGDMQVVRPGKFQCSECGR